MIFTSTRFKNKNLSLIAAAFISFTALLGLQACSSSSSSTPPVVNENAGGLFKGTGTVNTSTALADVRGFVHGTRFMFFDEATKVLYDGQITGITGSDLTATVDVYVDSNKVTTTSASVTGTVTSESSLSLTLAGTGFAAGTLTLTFDPLYNRGAAEATIAPQTYLGDTSTNANMTSINVMTGLIFDGSTQGTADCRYDGNVNIPDASINIYQLTLVITNTGSVSCDHLGTGYTGFFAVIDGSSADDTLLFAASNGTFANFSIMPTL